MSWYDKNFYNSFKKNYADFMKGVKDLLIDYDLEQKERIKEKINDLLDELETVGAYYNFGIILPSTAERMIEETYQDGKVSLSRFAFLVKGMELRDYCLKNADIVEFYTDGTTERVIITTEQNVYCKDFVADEVRENGKNE